MGTTCRYYIFIVVDATGNCEQVEATLCLRYGLLVCVSFSLQASEPVEVCLDTLDVMIGRLAMPGILVDCTDLVQSDHTPLPM